MRIPDASFSCQACMTLSVADKVIPNGSRMHCITLSVIIQPSLKRRIENRFQRQVDGPLVSNTSRSKTLRVTIVKSRSN